MTVVSGKLRVGDGFVTVEGCWWREAAWEREGERVIVKISLHSFFAKASQDTWGTFVFAAEGQRGRGSGG